MRLFLIFLLYNYEMNNLIVLNKYIKLFGSFNNIIIYIIKMI